MSDMLENKLKEYFADKEEVIAVYLFGSYAEGKMYPQSDIDIGILFDETSRHHMNKKRNTYMKELSRILRKDIHPTILNSASEGLMKQIFLKGRCVLINNSKKLSYFKMHTLAKIADFAFYRSRMQAGFIKNFMEE